MRPLPDCPFCTPSSDDIVLLETAHARIICDSRPMLVGHVLVAPKGHFASLIDMPLEERMYFDLLLTEACRRTNSSYGEVGAYEHGRSPLCRFELPDPRHLHAHAHVLPISVDIIRQANLSLCSSSSIRAQLKFGSYRYLYQKIGPTPSEVWALADCKVPRHFVRSQLQDALSRNTGLIELGAPCYVHDEAAEQTAKHFRAQAALSIGLSVIACPFDCQEIYQALKNDLASSYLRSNVNLVSDSRSPSLRLRFEPRLPAENRSYCGLQPLAETSAWGELSLSPRQLNYPLLSSLIHEAQLLLMNT